MQTEIKLKKNATGEYFITDKKGKIIIKDIHDVNSYCRKDGTRIITFRTNNNEYSYINYSGLFFDKYSYNEYELVCILVPGFSTYKIKKNGKYGILNDSRSFGVSQLNCEFDEIYFLRDLVFTLEHDLVKLKRNGRYSLIHGLADYHNIIEYDYIFTPVQPLDKFLVCKNDKYGFIDAQSLEGITEPVFSSVEELCKNTQCSMEKYSTDLYDWDVNLEFIQIRKEKPFDSPKSDIIYYIDISNNVKGKWNSVQEKTKDYMTEEVNIYSLRHPFENTYTEINKYGYFYNLFDCRKYDVVFHAIGKFYIFIQNNQYGIIDDEFHILLNPCFKRIRLVSFSEMRDVPLFVVSCNKGKFLYNAATGMKTHLYDSLSWTRGLWLSGNYKNYLVYKRKGKFGLISHDGTLLTTARFDLCKNDYLRWNHERLERGHAYFQEIFHEKVYGFYIENNKFYGIISINAYDSCIRIGFQFQCYFIAKLNGKYSLLNKDCKEINLPKLDDLIFFENRAESILYTKNNRYIKESFNTKPISETFLIGRIDKKYTLYSINFYNKGEEASLIISDCDEMEFMVEQQSYMKEKRYPYIKFKKKGLDGYVNENGEIIDYESFDEIKPITIDHKIYYSVCKAKKVGLLDSSLRFLLPCRYDKIIDFGFSSAKIIENGDEKEIKYTRYDSNSLSVPVEEEQSHYTEYSGSYAQDVMEYSDEDIDIIFDGEPDAYWNID